MRVNCSWVGQEIPLSSEIFSAIKDELWLFLIPAAFALLTLVLFLEEVGFFVRKIPSPRRRILSLWILGMYPVFALTSLVALYIPRSSSLCNFVASLYHSFTLLKFMGLITDLFGGLDTMMQVLSGQTVSPDPFPCCCCCCLPLVTVSRSSRAWMMVAVLQLSVVRSLLFFVTLVLWTDERYDYGDMDSVNPNLYVNGIIGVSTLLSFYGHLLFYKATRRALPGYSLRAKFGCIIAVLGLCGLQSSILETMGALRVIPCTPPFSVLARSQLIYHYCVIVEMFCISLYARHTFRKVEPSLTHEREEDEEAAGVRRHEEAAGVRRHEEAAGVRRHEEAAGVRRHEEKAMQTQSRSQSWGLSRDRGAGAEDKGRDPDRGAGAEGNRRSSGDSLCRIEHAPLETFSFPNLRPRPAEETSSAAVDMRPEPNSVTVV